MKKSFIISLSIFLILILLAGILFFALFPINYRDYVNKYSQMYGLDKNLVLGVINAESSFDKNAVSSAGARGLMQIMPATASEVAQKIGMHSFDVEQLFEPEVNIQIGCYYLRFLLNKFDNDTQKALCAYNAGYNNVITWLSTNGNLTDIPFKETDKYVKKVMRSANVYKYIYNSK